MTITPWAPTHQHLKSKGLYRVVTRGHMEADYPATAVVVYEDDQGRVFVRPAAQFDDGRFLLLATPAPIEQAAVPAAVHNTRVSELLADSMRRDSPVTMGMGKAEPAGDIEKQISAIIFEHVDFSPEDGGTTVSGLQTAARAILALFAGREKAAVTLLSVCELMLEPFRTSFQLGEAAERTRAVQSAIATAKAAGLGVRHD